MYTYIHIKLFIYTYIIHIYIAIVNANAAWRGANETRRRRRRRRTTALLYARSLGSPTIRSTRSQRIRVSRRTARTAARTRSHRECHLPTRSAATVRTRDNRNCRSTHTHAHGTGGPSVTSLGTGTERSVAARVHGRPLRATPTVQKCAGLLRATGSVVHHICEGARYNMLAPKRCSRLRLQQCQ